MKKYIMILLTICGIMDGLEADPILVPTPKSYKIGTGELDFNAGFRVIGNQAAAEWLRADIARNSGEGSGREVLVELKPLANIGGEAYQLKITDRHIQLYASSEAGFFRAAGRLLALLESSDWILPPMEISDEPDFPVRGMDLQMSFNEPMPREARYLMITQMIDGMARLGFNYVVFELGGNFQSAHHRSLLKTPWTEEELGSLVRYAKARGIQTIPGINTIGHMDRAPQLFPLKDDKGRVVGMDIRNPEFFATYRTVIDDLLSIFGNPPFIHLGGDESQAAFELLADTPETGAELFADLFNRIDQYLKTRNCRPVIWHDMLFAALEKGEIANGKMTAGARDRLSRNIIINYWNYDDQLHYDGISQLSRDGFEVWCSPWYTPQATAKLAVYAKSHKVAGMLGTTWSTPYKVGYAFIVTAVYGWNINGSMPRDPAKIFTQLSTRLPLLPHGKGIAFEIKMSDSSRRVIELKRPEAVVELMKSNPGAVILLQGALADKEMLMINNINTSRTANAAVLFTPSYGKTTGTNTYGDEWILRNGKSGKRIVNHGNAAIPADGAVISVHGSGNERQRWLGRALRSGGRAKLFAILSKGIVEENLTLPVSGNIAGFQFQFSAEYSFVGESEPAMEVTVKFKDGQVEKTRVKNDFLQRLEPVAGNFQVGAQNGGVYLLRWSNSSSKAVESVDVKLTKLGVLQGVSLDKGKVF